MPRGRAANSVSNTWSSARPGWVTEIHQAYAAAGAEVLKTHTFGANRVRLAEYGLAEKVRDLNFKAVRLVRDVREVTGKPIFIAGDMGPLGKRLQPNGPLTEQEVRDAFREQIGVLWEAGADLLLFETFIDLDELEIAVQVARQVCDLPIVASMTFAEDGLTVTGLSPADGGPAAPGCGGRRGGRQLLGRACLDAADRGVAACGRPRCAAQRHAQRRLPRAGRRPLLLPFQPRVFWPRDDGLSCAGGLPGGRLLRHHPHAHPLDAGGAGPAADGRRPGECARLSPASRRPSPQAMADYGVQEDEQPTGILRKLREGKFVISVEVDPPRGFNAQKQIEGARHAAKVGADAVNVADSPMARVRMSALSLCVQIQQQVGIETIVHYTTRDRSLMGLQADLIGARALGVRNILALTGDPPSLGGNQQSTRRLRRGQHRPRPYHRPLQPGA